jgi:hypothetical protein
MRVEDARMRVQKARVRVEEACVRVEGAGMRLEGAGVRVRNEHHLPPSLFLKIPEKKYIAFFSRKEKGESGLRNKSGKTKIKFSTDTKNKISQVRYTRHRFATRTEQFLDGTRKQALRKRRHAKSARALERQLVCDGL